MSTKPHPLVELGESQKSLIKNMKYLNSFLLACFKKNANERLTALELLEHPFLQYNNESIQRNLPSSVDLITETESIEFRNKKEEEEEEKSINNIQKSMKDK